MAVYESNLTPSCVDQDFCLNILLDECLEPVCLHFSSHFQKLLSAFETQIFQVLARGASTREDLQLVHDF